MSSRYINGWIKGYLRMIGWSVIRRHNVTWMLKKRFFLLRPDITIACSRAGSDTPIEMIVDAKYKNPISEENTRLSESDVYQMLAYAVRYQCNRLFLVYPVFRANKYFRNPLATYLIHNGNQEIRISALHIDIASEDLDQIQKEFIKLICHFF